MIVGQKELYEEAKDSLERIQNFDVTSLSREAVLGTKLNFADAIPLANQLIALYKRLSVTALEDFPDKALSRIRDNSNQNYNLFSEILDFDPTQQDPSSVRTNLIDNVKNAYPSAFEELYPYISYSLHRSVDFQRLDSEARATLQTIEDKSSKLVNSLETQEQAAKAVLQEIRRVAAEEGVTKQASHFNAEFNHHTSEARIWLKWTVWLSIALGIFAATTVFLHKIPILKPDDVYDTVQLSISKLLIFSVIAYMLFLSAKNFINHKHNSIVNKHRQNALVTYNALVEASGNEGVRDAVLLQAASCIFSPQSTGYSSTSDIDVSNQKSMIEIFSKPIVQNSQEATRNVRD